MVADVSSEHVFAIKSLCTFRRHYGPSSPREPLTLRRSTKATADQNVRLYPRENIETHSGGPVFSKEAHNIGPYVQLIIGFDVVIVTRLRTGWSGGSDPCKKKEIILFSESSRLAEGPTHKSYSMATAPPGKENGQGVKLTTQLHLEMSLRIIRATLALSLHAFMLWAGKIFTVAHVGVLSKSSPADAVGSFTGCQATESRS